MGLCSDAPDYPKDIMREQIAMSEAMGNRFLDLSEQQQAWAQNLWDETLYPMMQDVTGVQTEIMREQLRNARRDRRRYQDVYQPLEDSLIQEFQDYDTEERRTLESGRAMAQVQQAFDAQRSNAEQRLASYGVDPSQIRSQAIDSAARVRAAAEQARAGNDARRRVEDTGRALRAEAINIGRGMPSQVAASYGQSLSGGNSAMGNTNATAATGANMLGTGQSWGQMQGQALGQTMGGINNMYAGELAGYNASGGTLGALGNIAGQAFGAWAGSGFAEGGGAVGLQGSDLSPVPGPNDAIPVTLAEGEYIIPKDVVMRMGTEKLDKLIESTRQKAGEKGGANANTPAGEMPNPEPPIKGQTAAAEGGGAVGVLPNDNYSPSQNAEGGGAVGVMPVEMGMPVNPQWGYSLPQNPFDSAIDAAMYAQPGEGQMMDAENMAAMTAAVKDNYDEGKGLPGLYRQWKERRTGLTDANIAKSKGVAAAAGEAVKKAVPEPLAVK